MPKIFIAYLRSDSQIMASRIREYIASHVDKDTIFVDFVSIPFSVDFFASLRDQIAESYHVVLVIIGPEWAKIIQKSVDEDNVVYMQIREALRLGKFVIPVLVMNAGMPDFSDLPPDIQDLGSRHAAVVRDIPYQEQDLERLVSSIRWLSTSASPSPAPKPPAQPVPLEPPAAMPPQAPRRQRPQIQFGKSFEGTGAGARYEQYRRDEPAQTVEFSAFHPQQIERAKRGSFYAYAHTEAMAGLIAYDATRFRDELGGRVPEPVKAEQRSRLKIGAQVTFTPESAALTFDPPNLTRGWNGEWVRYGFEFTVNPAAQGDKVAVRLSVSVSGVEIAHIPFEMAFVLPAPLNPLEAAKQSLLAQHSAAMYQKIFVSYSRRDAAVAESYRQAQLAAGHDVFMDTYSIRVGENWQAALARGIDEADFFQLFWSKNSAGSPNCRAEWQYALDYKCREDGCAGFIRPVYWNEPMPALPPPELQHLNFRFVPLAGAGLLRRVRGWLAR